MPLFTIAEACELLDPPISERTMRTILTALQIRPHGWKRTGRPGHPSPTYEWTLLVKLHAALIPWLQAQRDSSATKRLLYVRAVAMPETARNAGRRGRPWRRRRAQVLAASTICWLCGHDGADSADHVISRAICIATGRLDLLEDPANLAPAHHKPCPTCRQRCNTKRGTGQRKQRERASRAW